MGPILFQAGVAIPIILFLAVYVSSRGKDPVGRHLAVLLWLILAWVVGMVFDPIIEATDAQRVWVGFLLYPPAIFMAPVFLLMMLHYARIEVFTERRSATWALLAPFALFFAAFLTNDWHGWMMRPGASLSRAEAFENAGPLFWAFQVWSNLAAVGGIALCGVVAVRDRSGAERRRMTLIVLSGSLPMAAHWIDAVRLLPIEYPITPAALAVTCLLMTVAIRQYRLLDVQPVARRDVIEASDDAIVIVDGLLRVVDCNPATLRLVGLERSEVLGRSVASLGAGDDPSRILTEIRDLLDQVVEDPAPVRREFETTDGRFIEATASPAHQRADVVAGYFVVLRDRSQERRAQHRLHHSQRLESVGILAAGVAHEVNNPLAFVRANLAHIRQSAEVVVAHADRLPEKVRDELVDFTAIVEESLDGLDRIQNIVRGLLQFSGRPAESHSPANVNEAVTVAARFASLGGRLSWEAGLVEELPDTSIPKDQLIQVLLNLFLNARDAVQDQDEGIVRVSTREDADAGVIEVRVEDNGPGVPAELRERIFDLFFTTRGPDRGTGLGLSIAHEILRENEGAIELDPDFREGAAFVLRLPVRAS